MLPSVKTTDFINWSPKQEQALYRDWGLYYSFKQKFDAASKYYDKALELDAFDTKALKYRSACKRVTAQALSAYTDCLIALKIEPDNVGINQEHCDVLYELNQFESCNIELHRNKRKFQGTSSSTFNDRLTVVNENIKDALGPSLRPFILETEHIFADVMKKFERDSYEETRPLWKVLVNLEKCDVMSILDKEKILLSPRETARRKRAFKLFNQIYYNRSWIDVFFLKNLRDDPNLLLPYFVASTPNLLHSANNKYASVKTLLKLLQARSPLYNERMRRFPDKRKSLGQREEHLNHIQYQTRRNMFTVLRNVRKLRAMGNINKLSSYVEAVMGDYVVVKTHRVMPWKIEFVNEVYNVLALANADALTVPEQISKIPLQYRLLVLLGMGNQRFHERAVRFVFGDKSTYQEPDGPDYKQITYKKYIGRLEKRLLFSKYSIEKSYLLYEIATCHLNRSHFDECIPYARKSCQEAEQSNNLLWQFLSTILMCKAQAAMKRIEKSKELLNDAFELAIQLKNPKLVGFIDVALSISQNQIAMKKRTQSEPMRKRSKYSLYSNTSSHSAEEPTSAGGSQKSF